MEVKASGDVKVVEMAVRIDAYTAKDVEAVLTGLVGAGDKKILCDFSQTEYISSAGLRVLLLVAKNLQKSGGELVLCSLKEYVSEVFETAGLIRIFKICVSKEEALTSLENN